MSSPVIVIAQLEAKPEFSAQFRAALEPLIAATLQEAGCLRYQLHHTPWLDAARGVGERSRAQSPSAASSLPRVYRQGRALVCQQPYSQLPPTPGLSIPRLVNDGAANLQRRHGLCTEPTPLLWARANHPI